MGDTPVDLGACLGFRRNLGAYITGRLITWRDTLHACGIPSASTRLKLLNASPTA